ncbi:hypothetical protein Hanom_Chr14g01245981 [Helianthus anomalus]
MLEALEKIKSELMLLGFLSLLLTVGTKYVAKICVPNNIGHKMLPCNSHDKKKHGGNESEHHRRLLSSAEEMSFRLLLA